MTLQERIKKVLKEETQIPLKLKRRLDFNMLDKIFSKFLDIESTRFIKSQKKGRIIPLQNFKIHIVTSIIQHISIKRIIDYTDLSELFNSLWNFILEYYSEPMEETYRKLSEED